MKNFDSIIKSTIATRNLSISLRKTLPLAAFAVGTLASNTLVAASYDDLEEILRQQKELIDQQRNSLDEQRKILQSQGREIESLKTGLERQTTADTQPAEPAPVTSRQKVTGAPATEPSRSRPARVAQTRSQVPDKPVGLPPPPIFKDARAVEIPRINESFGGVLTGRGNMVIEPSFEYSYTDNSRVYLDGFTFLPSLAVGLIDIREIKRHSSIATISGRYGLTDRIEMELKVPYIYRSDDQRSRPISIGVAEDEIFEASGEGLGDVQLALRYQLNRGNNGWPVFIANLVTSFNTGSSPFEVDFEQSTAGAVFPTELPTGSGYRSIQPSISLLYPTDPGVFFANVSYSWNEETDETISGVESTVDPGDTLGIGFGMGFSLNERSSFSLGYSHKHVLESDINGVTIPGSVLDIGQLSIGYSLRSSPTTNFNLSVSIGTTDDAQDVGLGLRFPISF